MPFEEQPIIPTPETPLEQTPEAPLTLPEESLAESTPPMPQDQVEQAAPMATEPPAYTPPAEELPKKDLTEIHGKLGEEDLSSLASSVAHERLDA